MPPLEHGHQIATRSIDQQADAVLSGLHARRIRAQPGGAAVHLVALTGYGGAEVKREAERAGFNLQLTKPIDIQGLMGLFGSYEAARRG